MERLEGVVVEERKVVWGRAEMEGDRRGGRRRR